MTRLRLVLAALALSHTATAAAEWDTSAARGRTREIDFTTREGTIQSLDLSPDGRWIVFDLLAHVYRVPAAGGAAECLTQGSGVALNFDPAYSPDGNSIAFVSDRSGQNSLWLMGADGSAPRLLAEGGQDWIVQPAWAPDGRSIVAVKYRIHRLSSGDWTVSSRIWRFPLDGSPPQHLIGDGLAYLTAPTVSADGRHVFYEQMAQPQSTSDYFLVSAAHHLRRFDLKTSASEAVTEAGAPHPFGYAAAPQVAPGDRTLAFVRRVPFAQSAHRGRTSAHASGLWLRDLPSGQERLLVAPITPDHFDTSDGYHLRFSPGYAWAADGRSIVLTEGGQIRRVNIASGAVTTIPFSAHVHRTISQMARPQRRIEDGGFDVRFIQHPASSPDGATLLFEAVGKIWRMALPDGTPRTLTTDGGGAFQYAPAWSPDGAWIAFVTWDDAAGGHLWKADANGGSLSRLSTAPGEYLNPVWSPQGKSVFVQRGRGASFHGLSVHDNDRFDLLRVAADDGSSKVVTSLGTIARMTFSPDGRLHYSETIRSYDSAGEGPDWNEYQPRIAAVSIRADGSDRREHAYFPFAGNAMVSPDGAHVAFHEADNVLLAALPPAAAGAPPFFNRNDADSPVQWITRSGGLDARWLDATKLEFVSGSAYHRHDLVSGRTTTTQIHLRVPRDEPRGRIAFTNARVLTMNQRQVLERATIVVTGSRISCVGACDTAGVDRIVDATGKTIMPGLFDAHAHPPWDGIIYRQHQPLLAIYLAYGVTTVFDPSAAAERVFPAAELIAAGAITGPRTYSTGPALVSTGDIRPIRRYEDAAEDVTRLASSGAISVKQYTQRRRDQRQWIVEAARRNGGLGVTGERLNLYYDLGMIMDGQSGWEHPITEHPTWSDVAKFVAQSRVNHTPAMQTAGQGLAAFEYWQARTDMQHDAKFLRYTPWREIGRFENHKQRPLEQYPILYWTETAKDILREGGSVAAGAHSKWDGVGLHRELWTFATTLTPMETLETATIHPARYLGLDRDLGTLEAGKLADLVVLDSNPLDDIRSTTDIALVMQGGNLYDDETLDRLWPQQTPYGPRPWLLPSQQPPAR